MSTKTPKTTKFLTALILLTLTIPLFFSISVHAATPPPADEITGYISHTKLYSNVSIHVLDGNSIKFRLSESNTITIIASTTDLNGSVSFYTTTTQGTFNCAPTTTGQINISATDGVTVRVNGEIYTYPFNYSNGTIFSVTWNMRSASPTSSPVYNQGIQNYNYYLLSDALTVFNQTAYGLDQTNTEISTSLSSTATGSPVYYGFRIYVLHYDGKRTELTDGNPNAIITHASTTAEESTATWTPPRYFLDLGYDAIQVETYVKIGSADWALKSTHHTTALLYKEIPQQTWTFTLYTNTTITASSTATYSFGSSTYPTHVELALLTPSNFDVGTYYLGAGNIIMFILTQYTMQLSAAFYLFILLIPCGTLYVRHRHIGPVLLLFMLFGFSGSVLWAMIPPYAAAFIDAILILGLVSIVWRLLR